jgi:hypothetical protein
MNAKQSDAGTRRGGRAQSLGRTLSEITKPVFGKRGLADGAIVTDWPEIAGPELARHSQPEKIAYAGHQRAEGTLHLRIDHSGMATELQHLEPLVIERVNAYFGFRAVAALKLIHGPLPGRETTPRRQAQPLSAEQQEALAGDLMNVEDADLRQALERLGTAVMGRREPP